MIPTELALKGKAAVGAVQRGGMWLACLGFIAWPSPFAGSGSLKIVMKIGKQRSM